jgi:hypothetical protein
MIDDETKKRIYVLCTKPVALGGWLGLPYEDEGCLKFAIKFYAELGIELTKEALYERRNFVPVGAIESPVPRFGDIAVFHGVEFFNGFHIGVMLDYRRCIQCITNTNGVGTIDISRQGWASSLKGLYRHKDLCS